MIDNQADILKAFFAALSVQTQPLPHEVQLALNNIGKTGKIEQLVIVAEGYAPLTTLFKAAHTCLVKQGKEQRKGRDTKPKAESEKETTLNTEIDNVSGDFQDLNSLPTILENIQKRQDNVLGQIKDLNIFAAILAKIQRSRNNEEIIALAPEILNTTDSVESAKEIFLFQMP